MNFNSLGYVAFLPVTVILNYLLPKKIKTPVLLLACYFFYIQWEPSLALVMLSVTVLTYFAARVMPKTQMRGKKAILILTLVLSLGTLFFFKYFNFSVRVIYAIFRRVGITASQTPTFNILLPAGISFYTFQAVGYSVDVYRGKIEPEKNFLTYALFVSFFPQIIAGPIERAGNVIPQIKEKKRLDLMRFREGVTLIIWGYMKKMLLADNLAVLVNTAYGDPQKYTGVQLLFATLCFAVQIYCDFSACTDLARGSAKLVGIDLMENFRCPYAATSIKDFWRRWHISLSTWFRDYLYFPLGGSRVTKFRHCLNVMIVFLVSGLWHGASLTFVVWGALHGAYQIAGILLTPFREKVIYKFVKKDSRALVPLKILGTLFLVSVAWVFFAANSVGDAWFILKRIALIPTSSLMPLALGAMGVSTKMLAVLLIFAAVLLIVDVFNMKHPVLPMICKTVWIRYAVYFVLLLSVFMFGYYGPGFDAMDFVYFKF